MQITYTGTQSSAMVIVDRRTGREYITDEDGNVEVPDDLATNLLEQSIWEEAETGEPPAPTINTSTEESNNT